MRDDMGHFITVEGPDGSGKTSVIKYLEKRMKDMYPHYHVVITREPGGNRISETIRQIILEPKNIDMGARCEALLYAASRAQHVFEKIEPLIKQDDTLILCDRFIDSSLVYQGIGRNLGIDAVMAINMFATGGIMPEYTLFLDIEPIKGLNRILADNDREYNRLDMEKLEFHDKVYQGYLGLIESDPNRFIVVDADNLLDKVCEAAWESLKRVIDNETV